MDEKLAKEIHENAVNHGWWESERPISEIRALLHSEASEALEAYRKGDTENLAEELADIKIRAMDALGGRDSGVIKYGIAACIPSDIDYIHEVITSAGAEFELICEAVDRVAKRHGLDVDAALIKKHNYNKTRPYRHGNKRC